MKTHDVYSYGVVSSSTLYGIRGAFPAPEGYAEIDAARYMTGGEAANSSIVLSRLGVRVKLDGNWLGADDAGTRTKALLSDYGIDTSRLPLKKGYQGAREVVFAAPGTRTIFGTYGRLLDNGDWNLPRESDVTQARAVCLDPFFAEASLRAGEIAADAGIPVVTTDCRHDDPLLGKASAVVVAESYLRDHYAQRAPEDVFDDYRRATEGIVIFTFGAAPSWSARPGEAVRLLTPYPVDAVDTTGAGDSFRAGIVYGFLQGWDDDRLLKFATAVAALVCTRFPGVLDAPTRDEVEAFIQATKQ